jgi:HSP20 family protein
MTLMRFSPMRELMSMHDQLNRLFDENLARTGTSEVDYGTWAPAVDLREEADSFILQADLPGVKKDDIEINVENSVLTIRGERRFEQEVKKETYHRIERAYGKFTRAFTLPSRVKAEGITANYKDGTLEVVIPKAEESKPKRISIQG